MATAETHQPRPSRLPIIAAGLVAVVLAALLIVVYVTLSGRIDTANKSLHAAQHQITAMRKALVVNAAAIKNTKQTSISGVQKKVAILTECLPELQQELNGLNVSTAYQTYAGVNLLTSAYLTNPTIVSTACRSALNGS